MKLPQLLSVCIAGLLCAAQAQAQSALSGDLGTTGVGVHLSLPVQGNLNARFGVNYLNYSYNSHTTDVDYDFKLKLRTFDALLDFFPMDGGFRLSAGLVYNGNKIDAHGKPNSNGSYTINGNTYLASTAGTIDGKIDFRKAAPYLGIGWGNPVKQAGWGISGDLGVLLQGSPSTSLLNTDCTAPAPICTRLAGDVATENATLADKAHDFKAYPVLRVGASYRF